MKVRGQRGERGRRGGVWSMVGKKGEERGGRRRGEGEEKDLLPERHT